MFAVKAGATWFDASQFSGLNYATQIRGGSSTCSWKLRGRTPMVALPHEGDLVEVVATGNPVWAGEVTEVTADGEVHADGIARQADRAAAIDATGTVTTIPDVAVAEAIARGALAWTQRDVSATAWGEDTPAADLRVGALLDGYCADNGLRWTVDARNREFVTYPDATSPLLMVDGLGNPPGVTTDDFATHMIGLYLAGVGDLRRTNPIQVGTSRRRVEKIVDLYDRGFITEAAAEAILVNMAQLDATGEPTLGEPLTLTSGMLTTMGGRRVPPWYLTAGAMVRVYGASDQKSPWPFVDVRIGETTYDADSDTLTASPVNAPARGFVRVLSALAAR